MARQISTTPPTRPALRVLIVDDVPEVRRDLRLLLGLAGGFVVVGEAADGREALSKVTATRPDVVVMDLQMPGLDGAAAAREIKARGFAGRIVILSIHAEPADVRRAQDAGADAFVPKGASLDSLLTAIRVSGRRMADADKESNT